MINARQLSIAISVLVILTGVAVVAKTPEPDFAREVLPILSEKCFVCHGPDAKADERKLTSYEEAVLIRNGIQAINPHELKDSLLLARISDQEDPMPPLDEKPLSDSERDILESWVLSGAKYAKHWAFEKPQRDTRFDSVDEFIQADMRANEIDFSQEANLTTLARRASLVLTGLPPTVESVEALVSSKDPYAFNGYVGQLLQSEHYGEHRARYWLDAVRYGDTSGLARDVRRGLYPYRDWVIQAFNDNLPMDQFITWQLAGDLLPEPSLEQRVATGYVRMNPTTNEGGSIPEEFQAKNNFDRVENLGTVFLGLSLQCARCHTHKYDPITHEEYFQLFAFFNNTAEKPLDGYKYDLPPVEKAPRDIADWKRHKHLKSLGFELSGEEAFELAEIEGRMSTTLVAEEGEPRPTFLLERGDYYSPSGPALQPGVIAAIGGMPKDAPRNRLGLARWLTAPDNPLVARVLVNRLWQQVFGVGLVRTPEEFGLQGEHPTHPELLDFLALEFQSSGWDQKAMLRRLVLSRTFRQSSVMRLDIDDPENRLYARGPSFRLDAEVIRDSTLLAADLLDPFMGGEGVKPYQPPGLWELIGHQKSNTRVYVPDTGPKVYRRSIYVYWKRASPHPMMTIFDAPNRESACARRSRTDTPLQSLALLNEPQRIYSARKLAESIIDSRENDEALVDRLFETLAGREANLEEKTACTSLFEKTKSAYSANPSLAESLLEVGGTQRNESLDPIEVAAWTQVVVAVMASDPFILLY
ncbi:PSD1 and planctomycete cytochrome C domain-containing protein [Opitutia bacterium ISCC 51]|nr:PSD1 and planctomycete cytochrome C domain-containing protein [Opitutae bacterium ISCC 51]QXD27392.1 PSD1 and planctomycete cytochrome C domain-containing protein [Opitutae bacterium ISCC 52]